MANCWLYIHSETLKFDRQREAQSQTRSMKAETNCWLYIHFEMLKLDQHHHRQGGPIADAALDMALDTALTAVASTLTALQQI
jgi:hypothetical protein